MLFDEIASGAFVVYSEGINDIISAEKRENLYECVQLQLLVFPVILSVCVGGWGWGEFSFLLLWVTKLFKL